MFCVSSLLHLSWFQWSNTLYSLSSCIVLRKLITAGNKIILILYSEKNVLTVKLKYFEKLLFYFKFGGKVFDRESLSTLQSLIKRLSRIYSS